MLVESAIGNIFDAGEPPPSDSIDWLDMSWLDCRRRFARRQTRSGREVRILLRLGQRLKHGDILGHWPDQTRIVVDVIPTPVLVVDCPTAPLAIAVAFQIGNLHLPIEVDSTKVIVPSNAQTEAMLIKFEFAFERKSHRFQPTHWPDLIQISDTFQLIRSIKASGE